MRYTTEQKNHAITCLKQNEGDLTLTSIQTGIPRRTLYDWKRQLNQPESPSTQKNFDPPPPPHAKAGQQQKIDEIKALRDRLMQRLKDLAYSMDDDPQITIAISRLLDRLIKLDQYIAQLAPPEKVIRVEYQYVDGTVHNMPPWENPDYMVPDDIDIPGDRLSEFRKAQSIASAQTKEP